MARNMNRRDFLKKSALFGMTAAAAGKKLIPYVAKGRFPKAPAEGQISVVTGTEYYNNTIKAVELIGGMEKYIPKGSRVAILPNNQSRHPGTFTNPEIVKAVIHMCQKAGAKEVNCLSWLPEKFWSGSDIGAVVKETGANLKLSGMKDEFFKPVPLPEGKALETAYIIKELYNNDIFINIPITKDHAGNKFTGTMKNYMGLNSPGSNRTFHKKNWETDPKDLEHLDQCIADLNLAVTPDLCIVDATVFITTSGPFGPGKLAKPQKIVAGTDRIAVDSYCTGLLNLKPEDIIMIKRGYEHGLGEIDLSKVKIKEVTA